MTRRMPPSNRRVSIYFLSFLSLILYSFFLVFFFGFENFSMASQKQFTCTNSRKAKISGRVGELTCEPPNTETTTSIPPRMSCTTMRCPVPFVSYRFGPDWLFFFNCLRKSLVCRFDRCAIFPDMPSSLSLKNSTLQQLPSAVSPSSLSKRSKNRRICICISKTFAAFAAD